jgi:hypothetical protein
MRIRHRLLIIFVLLFLTSCGSGKLFGATITPTSTTTATPSSSPTATATPTATPTLPPILQEFLNRYDDFKEMSANVEIDYHWQWNEINGVPDGEFNGSALIALEQGRGTCSEAALVSSLFAEKHGYHPYILSLTLIDNGGNRGGHMINVFQELASKLWGYDSNFIDYHPATFSSIEELANYFMSTHTYTHGEYYEYWDLVDLNRIEEVYNITLDWRTSTRNVPIGAKTYIASGQYIP